MLNKQHRTRVVGWIDHPYVQVVMMTFLMVALFASDVAAIQSASPETMDAVRHCAPPPSLSWLHDFHFLFTRRQDAPLLR